MGVSWRFFDRRAQRRLILPALAAFSYGLLWFLFAAHQVLWQAPDGDFQRQCQKTEQWLADPWHCLSSYCVIGVTRPVLYGLVLADGQPQASSHGPQPSSGLLRYLALAA